MEADYQVLVSLAGRLMGHEFGCLYCYFYVCFKKFTIKM